MDIKIDKLISGSNGTLACVSDETILAIGKRYFELASGKEPVNPTYVPAPVTDELLKEIKETDTKAAVDVVKAAYIIKEYCKKRMCPGCPFSYQTVSTDLLCKCVLRNDNEASITPEKWELPLKGV